MIVVRHSYISTRGRRRAGGPSPKVVAIGRALSHVKYIQHRPGPDRELGGRDFFNETEDNADASEMREAIRELGNGVVVHKITLAPEINPEDKQAFTREVMKQLGDDKGLELQWWAVEHNNTQHHHIHVVVLGKDKNGREVHLDKRDYDRIKDHGDRHLERRHPHEMERARLERERKEKERMDLRNREREAARQERIKEGLELPWMHRKVVREQLEPYEQWKKEQEQLAARKAGKDKDIGDEYHQETIEAVGREWSGANTLQELHTLHQYLWDNYDERIPKEEYKKLIGWIKDKEQSLERDQDKTGKSNASDSKRDSFEYKGEKYSKDSSYEQLKALDNQLRENKQERLPIDDYQQLKSWIENRDRERWSGVISKELEIAKQQHTKEEKSDNSPAGGRWVDPVQEQIMGNPLFQVFMGVATVAEELVRAIPLSDQRDILKESRDELEEAKRDREAAQRGRSNPEDKAKDEEIIGKIDDAIEKNKETRKQNKEDEAKAKDNQDRDLDVFS